MPGSVYGEPSLLDIIKQVQESGSGVRPPQAPTAPGVLSAGAEETLAKLQEAAFAPDQEAPPEKKGAGYWVQGIGSALGDALSNYGAALAGRQGTANYLDKFKAGQERRKAQAAQQNKERQGAKRDAAKFLLGRELTKKDIAERTAADRELQKAEFEQKQKLQNADIAAEQSIQAQKIAQDKLEMDTKQKWEERKISLQGAQDQAVARIHAGVTKGDDQSKFDQKTLPEIMSNIGGLADVAKIALAGGDPASKIPGMTPDVMRARVRRMIDGSAMGPDAKKAAYAFAERELEQEIKDYEQSQAPQQGAEMSPSQGNTPGDAAIMDLLKRGGSAIGGALTNPYPNR